MVINNVEITAATQSYIAGLLQESLLFEESLQVTIANLQTLKLKMELHVFLNQYALHSLHAGQQLQLLIAQRSIDLQGKSARLFDLVWQEKSKFIKATAAAGGADFLLCMLLQQLSFLKMVNFTTLCVYYRSIADYEATVLMEQLQLAEQDQHASITTYIARQF